MCLVIKLTLFAWSSYDGTKKEEDLYNAYQKSARILKEPTFLEFFSYCLFFPGFFTGPACDYYEFEEILNRKYTEDENKPGQFESVRKKLILGLVYTVVYSSLGSYNFHYLISQEGLSKPFLYRVLYLNITGVVCRFKFYIAWTLAEASYNLVGIGYSGMSKKDKPIWSGIENANVKLEFSENINSLVNHWNVRTTLWLRHCIYDRINKYLGTTSSVIGVYTVDITSAIWHGTYSGYFLAFLSAASYNPIVKSFRKSVSPFIHEKHAKLHKFKFIYDILAIIVSQNIINFSFAPFILLTIDDSWKLWKSLYFYVIIGMFITFLILKVGGVEKILYQKQIDILKINPYKKHRRIIKDSSNATSILDEAKKENEEKESIQKEKEVEKEIEKEVEKEVKKKEDDEDIKKTV
jgi:lysophospholipid acyltransferase